MSDRSTLTRRAATRLLGFAAAALALAGWRPRRARGQAPAPADAAARARHRGTGTADRPAKWGMSIDLDRCTGCTDCSVACRVENNIPIAGPDQSERGRQIAWMDAISETVGSYPDVERRFMPTPCNHCAEAPCVKVCPVGATYINPEGIVAQIWARCIGCRYCTVACPYTRRYFNWETPQFTDAERQQLNPDVGVRPVGVVEKCTFCHQRIDAARVRARVDGRHLSDDDVRRLPACAEACPTQAITFGDLDDPDSAVTQCAKSPRAVRLLEELGTEPKVYYLRDHE